MDVLANELWAVGRQQNHKQHSNNNHHSHNNSSRHHMSNGGTSPPPPAPPPRDTSISTGLAVSSGNIHDNTIIDNVPLLTSETVPAKVLNIKKIES